MSNLPLGARLEDWLTFGAGYVPFLALPVPALFPFVVSLFGLQNTAAPYGPLSSVLYTAITPVALGVSYRTLRRVGAWTFSPSLHRRLPILVAVGCYFGVSLAVVSLGYLVANPVTGAVTQLDTPDVLVGITVSSFFTAVISTLVLRLGPGELFDRPRERMRRIDRWQDALADARDTDVAGRSQVETYHRLVDHSEELLDTLTDAKTNEGTQLRRAFESWLTDFRDRSSSVSRRDIVTGETENPRLVKQHKTLTMIEKQLSDIGDTRGDESWNDTSR